MQHSDENHEPGSRSGPDPAAPDVERTVAELFSDAATDVGILLSTQIDLAKLELRDEALRTGRAVRFASAAVAAAAVTMLLIALAAAAALGDALGARALGDLAVAAVAAAVTGVLTILARRRCRAVGGPVPRSGLEDSRPGVAQRS